MKDQLASDCRFYQGDRPCEFHQRCPCNHHEPMGFRILIIKLGALGDVVRTAGLPETLKRIYPQSHITWVSRKNGVRILEGHPLIDRRVVFNSQGILTLTQQYFDLVLSLDKEQNSAALCNAVSCPDKRGVGLSPWGTVVPINPACKEYFNLGLDDDLKFYRNTKSYPELIHESLGFEYIREPYRLFCGQTALKRARRMFDVWRNDGRGFVVGLNTGSGCVFVNKTPKPARWVEWAKALLARQFTVVLLGGPQEARTNEWILEQVGPELKSIGCEHSEQQFVAMVDQCDLVIAGDTLALHVAVAREVPVVALFGPTCEQEIDLFGLGTKIISPVDCGPCYKRRCQKTPNCMDSISTQQVLDAVEALCRVSQANLTPVIS